jgi:hypothetical protein
VRFRAGWRWRSGARGFRVSIFDPKSEEFRLTIPYQMMRTVEGATLTFVQG